MSISYKIAELIIKKKDVRGHYAVPEEEMLKYLERDHRRNDLPPNMYKSFRVTVSDRSGHKLFRIEPRDGGGEHVILMIHGGGGIIRPTPFHYKMAAELIKGTGAALYFPLYPLAPPHGAEESLEWLEEVYGEILKKYEPERITVIGDSAGAVMAAAMLERSDVKPAGVVLISPAVGVDRSDERFIAAEKRDIILSYKAVDFILKYRSGGASPKSSYMNAMAVDYTGFPPILLFYGTNEMFYPAMAAYTDKIRGALVELTVREGKGMFHDWAIASAYPEGRKAIREMCGFVLGK